MGVGSSSSSICDSRREDLCRSSNLDPYAYMTCFLGGKDLDDNVVRDDTKTPIGSFRDCVVRDVGETTKDLLFALIKDPRTKFEKAIKVDRWRDENIATWVSAKDSTGYRLAWNNFLKDEFGVSLPQISAPLTPAALRYNIMLESASKTLMPDLLRIVAVIKDEFGEDSLIEKGLVIVLRRPLSNGLPDTISKIASTLNPYVQRGMPISFLIGYNADNDDINWVRKQIFVFSDGEVEPFTSGKIVKKIEVDVGNKSVQEVLEGLERVIDTVIGNTAQEKGADDKRRPAVILQYKNVPENWEGYSTIEAGLKERPVIFIRQETTSGKSPAGAISDLPSSGDEGSREIKMRIDDYYMIDEIHFSEGGVYSREVVFNQQDTLAFASVSLAAKRCIEGGIANYCASNAQRAKHLVGSHGIAELGYVVPHAETFAPFSLAVMDPPEGSGSSWDGKPIDVKSKQSVNLEVLNDFYTDPANQYLSKVVNLSADTGMKDKTFGQRMKEIAQALLRLKGGVNKGREVRLDIRLADQEDGE